MVSMPRPRGDPPGFIEIVDDKTLLMADRRGNNRIDSLRNILANPHVALLFLVPGIGETLRVNGTAEISADPELLQRFTHLGKAAAHGDHDPHRQCLLPMLARPGPRRVVESAKAPAAHRAALHRPDACRCDP